MKTIDSKWFFLRNYFLDNFQIDLFGIFAQESAGILKKFFLKKLLKTRVLKNLFVCVCDYHMMYGFGYSHHARVGWRLMGIGVHMCAL